jgi:hypothetical protein
MGATINLRGKGLELPGWLTGQNRLMRTPLIFLPYQLWKRYFAPAAAFVLIYALARCCPTSCSRRLMPP